MADKVLKSINIGKDSYKVPSLTEELGLTVPEFATLLSRDFYTPVLDAKPTASTLTYQDPALGSMNFRTAQNVIYPDSSAPDGVDMSFFVGTKDGKAVWRSYINRGSLATINGKSLEQGGNIEIYEKLGNKDYGDVSNVIINDN